MKIDAAGNVSWSKDYSGSKDDILQDMLLMPNGNILLSGCSNSAAGGGKTAPQIGSYDQWLICIDANGFPLWEKTYGAIGSENVCTLLALNDGNYLIVGEENTGTAGTLRKIDPQGNIIWSRSCGPGLFRRASQDANGKIYVAGESYAGITGCKTSPLVGGNPDYWITVYDAMGNKMHDMDYGGSADDYLITDIRVIDRDVWVLGQTNSNFSGNKTALACGGSDGWIIRLSSLYIHPPTPVALCSNNNSFNVDYTVFMQYQPGNVFTAQLSDINGNFSTHTNIGSVNSNGSGIIPVNLPAGLPASDNYKIRLVASLPADTSSGYIIAYHKSPQVFLGNDTTICSNIPLTLTTGSPLPSDQFLWNDGSTGSTLTVSTAGAYSCTVQNNCGTASDVIQINSQTGSHSRYW